VASLEVGRCSRRGEGVRDGVGAGCGMMVG
jgi:hypothetical protein